MVLKIRKLLDVRMLISRVRIIGILPNILGKNVFCLKTSQNRLKKSYKC